MIGGISNTSMMNFNTAKTSGDKEIEKIEKSLNNYKSQINKVQDSYSSAKETKKSESDNWNNDTKNKSKNSVEANIESTKSSIKAYKAAKKSGDEKGMEAALQEARSNIAQVEAGVQELIKVKESKPQSDLNINISELSDYEKQVGQNVDNYA